MNTVAVAVAVERMGLEKVPISPKAPQFHRWRELTAGKTQSVLLAALCLPGD